MIWFSADHHFGHANIIKFCKRPYFSVEEMDADLIENWNRVVDTDDTVYYLGDFTLGSFQRFKYYVGKLNGNISIVPGGHDGRWVDRARDSEVRSKTGKVDILPQLDYMVLPIEGKKYPLMLVLCHYPLLSWERSHYGSIHLHGHTHGTIKVIDKSRDKQLPPGQRRGLRMDVGVDPMGYEPISLVEVCNELGVDYQKKWEK